MILKQGEIYISGATFIYIKVITSVVIFAEVKSNSVRTLAYNMREFDRHYSNIKYIETKVLSSDEIINLDQAYPEYLI